MHDVNVASNIVVLALQQWKENVNFYVCHINFINIVLFVGPKKEEYTLIHKIDKTVADFPFDDKEFYEKVYSMDDFFMNADYKDWFEPDTTY